MKHDLATIIALLVLIFPALPFIGLAIAAMIGRRAR